MSQSSSSPQDFPVVGNNDISLSPAQRTSILEICTLMNLAPLPNAVSQFGKSEDIIRSSMSQIRVNNLLVLHAHKDRTDALSIAIYMSEQVC